MFFSHVHQYSVFRDKFGRILLSRLFFSHVHQYSVFRNKFGVGLLCQLFFSRVHQYSVFRNKFGRRLLWWLFFSRVHQYSVFRNKFFLGGGSCFEECSSLKTVTCEIPAPIGDNFIFFDYAPINEATLYVPEASLNSYKTTSPWSGFGTILAIKSSGIETNTVGTSATVDAIYNLEGKRIGGIKRGMNILRMSDGTTRKIMK